MYSFGIICLHTHGISSLLIPLTRKQITPFRYVPSSWRRTLGFETCIRHRTNYNVNFTKVYFVGLYYTIILQHTVQKNVNFIIKLRIRFERRPIKNDGIDETSGAYKGTALNILPVGPDENVQLAHLSLNRMIIIKRVWRLSIRLNSNYGLHKWSGFCWPKKRQSAILERHFSAKSNLLHCRSTVTCPLLPNIFTPLLYLQVSAKSVGLCSIFTRL